MPKHFGPPAVPSQPELAALRAWYEGLSSRDAVAQYLTHAKPDGASARGMLGDLRRAMVQLAESRGRRDLAPVFCVAAGERARHAKAMNRAIETLLNAPPSQPLIGDEIDRWLDARAVSALKAAGIKTLAALTVRVPRRRRWWTAVPGLGAAGARKIEAFFQSYPELTERARRLIVVSDAPRSIVPWEALVVPEHLDGSRGAFRAPAGTSTLRAGNDYQAVQAWLSLHEATATRRAYRKEAERLVLWAIIERGLALSSLSTEDAVAYRAFLQRPSPRDRWVGPPRPRNSPEWRPFADALAPRSVAYALSVLGAMYRWLLQQRYVLANPFAGIKVRGAIRGLNSASMRYFNEAEWQIVQVVAEGLEWSYGWTKPAAQRMRFLLDFSYATGLRASELVEARLGMISTDDSGDRWINIVGKGSKAGSVALPPLATTALDRYLAARQVPTTPALWDPATPLVGSLEKEAKGGITPARFWSIVKRFFSKAADVLQERNPTAADKLRRASPHWMRHTHATHALAGGAELPTVRDNLRHASLSTTSMYLHTDEMKRAQQIGKAFKAR